MNRTSVVWNPASPQESVGHYALQGAGTLRVYGSWDDAIAKAAGVSWRFVRTGPLRRNVTASNPDGDVIGDYRERDGTLRWGSRELHLRRGWNRRTVFPRNGRYALAEGGRIHALLDGSSALLRPVDIELPDPGLVEPGLLLWPNARG